jgi:hypothetical protein
MDIAREKCAMLAAKMPGWDRELAHSNSTEKSTP